MKLTLVFILAVLLSPLLLALLVLSTAGRAAQSAGVWIIDRVETLEDWSRA